MSEETRNHPPVHKELDEAAVKMALEGRWQEAEQLNREIVEREPENVEALNRLGKALLELRRYEESYAIYSRSLELDAYNRIARKNRERLSILLASTPMETAVQAREHEQILPDLFISESGKSAVVPLYTAAPQAMLQRLGRGEAVRLEAAGQAVLVKTEEGVLLGRLDPRIGRRLAEFIQVGNRYAAAIAESDENSVKVFVRETYQHPRLVGRLSFPPLTSAPTEMVRPYIRDLGLHLEEAFEQDLIEEEEEEDEIEEEEDLSLDEEDLDADDENLRDETPEDESFEEDIEEEI
jgi:tetratricopeptide (TPR) repeat protein